MRTEIDREPQAKEMLLSLFSGAGGLDLGFEQAGYSISVAVDIRPSSIETFNHNRRERSGHACDVKQITVDKLDDLAGGLFAPDGIIGGPPCQSFSRAAHSSENDHRHDLPFEFSRLLRDLNHRTPISFFVFENVPGLLRIRHTDRYNAIRGSFEEQGFEVTCELLNASWYGVAQNRQRLILVGFNKALYPGLKWTPPKVETVEPAPIKSLLLGLPDPVFWSRNLEPTEIKPHPNHWCMTPKSKNFQTPGSLVPGMSRGRSFRTLHWDRPSPTIAYGNREVHVHPTGRRRLSVYEAMLLQGFPKSYELRGTLSDQISQVSEAVPPPMAYAIAKSVRGTLLRYRAEERMAS